MKALNLVHFFALIIWCCGPAFSQIRYQVDVCVYGGTSAGVIAAFTAEKLGKRTVLIEPGKHLGGMTSGGLGYTDIGNKAAITGLARDFYRRVGRHYGKFEQWIFEPHVAENIFNDYVSRGGFQVLMETRLKDVVRNGNSIQEIVLENSSDPSQPNIIITALMFIDCGYEGDLMAKSGVPYAVGREPNSTYKETLNGVQLLDGHQFPDGVDPYIVPGKKNSGLVWGVSEDTLQQKGTGDKKVQAYNYRICLSSEPANQVAITRPADYDSSRYELLLRLFNVLPQKRRLNDYFIWSKMPGNKTDVNNRGAFSTDMIGMNYNYPDGSYEERKEIIRKHEAYTKGLLYFLGHDERVPAKLRDEMLMWGYPKDEYVDNGHWSHQLYIRESRRMIGEYVMTQANCEGKRKVGDGIALGAYTMDSHNCQRIVVDGQVKNEGNVESGGFGPYPISYRAIIPKEEHVTNLFVPVCLSATHIAYGSIRMEPVFMVLGQSAATAAAMAIDQQVIVQDVPVKELQHQLRINPLAEWAPPDIICDNADTRHAKASSRKWDVVREGGYGRDFMVTDPIRDNKFLSAREKRVETFRFTPGNRQPGDYKVFIYIPVVKGISDHLLVKISDGLRIQERILHTKTLVVEGQTSGEWVSLGQQTIVKAKKPWVEITTVGANGKVVADAVIWVPAVNDSPPVGNQ